MASKSSSRTPLRRDLSVKNKFDILQQYDQLPKMSQREAAAKLGISQPLLNKLLKDRVSLENAYLTNDNVSRKRKRGGKDEEVEAALLKWFTHAREKDVRLSGPVLREKAEALASKLGKDDFEATEGWFRRWAKRENIVYKKPKGEVGDADAEGADVWLTEEWPRLVSQYSPDDIYNADETGLYYRALPETTYAFKDENTKGCKLAKDRISVLCCASLTGKKEPLLVIGKSVKPRCFKNVNELPLPYLSNAKAWMTSILFNQWLRRWDRILTRNILLLIDNCPGHTNIEPLKHIRVIFLPPNTTALIQPMDQGVIRTLKAYYRKGMRRRIVAAYDDILDGGSAAELARKTDLLTAMHLLNQAWEQVTKTTIANCYRKGGFSPPITDELAEEDEIPPPDDMTIAEFNEWLDIDKNLETSAPVTDDSICEQILEERKDEPIDDDLEDCAPVVEPPSRKEVLQALEVIRRNVQCKGTSDNFYKFYNFEKTVISLNEPTYTQSTITQFF